MRTEPPRTTIRTKPDAVQDHVRTEARAILAESLKERAAKEKRILVSAKGKVRRQGEVLSFLENGRVVSTLKDEMNLDKPGELTYYSLVSYVRERDAFVVKANFYEGGCFLLMKGGVAVHDGDSKCLMGQPVWSPAKKSFAIAEYDPHFDRSRLSQIWTCGQKTCSKQADAVAIPETYSLDVTWKGEDIVEFRSLAGETPETWQICRRKGKWTCGLTPAEECERMLKAGELKAGVTLQDCLRAQ